MKLKRDPRPWMRTLWFVEFRARRGRAKDPDSWVLYDFTGYQSRAAAVRAAKRGRNRDWVYRAVAYDRRKRRMEEVLNVEHVEVGEQT